MTLSRSYKAAVAAMVVATVGGGAVLGFNGPAAAAETDYECEAELSLVIKLLDVVVDTFMVDDLVDLDSLDPSQEPGVVAGLNCEAHPGSPDEPTRIALPSGVWLCEAVRADLEQRTVVGYDCQEGDTLSG